MARCWSGESRASATRSFTPAWSSELTSRATEAAAAVAPRLADLFTRSFPDIKIVPR